jgi:hypothetical protein
MTLTSESTVSQLIERLSSELQLPVSQLQETAVDLNKFLESLQSKRGSQPNGILLGRVQSGKTTAMLLLSATARDRGEKVVILLLGTTTILYKQNLRRLEHAFSISRGQSEWALIKPSSIGTAAGFARNTLQSGRTLLIPILKHYRWIDKASALVRELQLEQNTVVIDDESDIASLGNGTTGPESPRTNSALRQLLGSPRDAIYVHVTATPYGPLLLDPNDRLAPAAFNLLTPGEGYVGSQEFFIDKTAANVRVVSIDEIAQVSMGRTAPSLGAALGIFTAISIKAKIDNPDMIATSMLIHPSSSVIVHRKVERAVRQIQSDWVRVLATGEIPRDLDLGCGTAGISSVSPARLRNQLSLMKIHIVNAGGSDQIDWSGFPAHILIGGNKLSRGFTIEGLTVTYVARKPSPQADTMLQRARFYGYRLGLGGLMHLFASKKSLETWSQAARMEKQLWDRLQEIASAGGDVADLRRVVNAGASVSATAQLGGTRARLLPSPWYPSSFPSQEEWSDIGESLKSAIGSRNFKQIEAILSRWPSGSTSYGRGVQAPAFGLPMVHSFVERLRAQEIAGVIHENSVEVKTDSQNRLIGLLANKEWKLFEQSVACGIFLIRIRVQSGEGYIPILHQRGAVITLN